MIEGEIGKTNIIPYVIKSGKLCAILMNYCQITELQIVRFPFFFS